MKLDTLKTIESALNDAIVAEGAKVELAKEKLENALRDALNKPEIGRGKKLPTRPYDENRLGIGCALDIIEETFKLTESDAVKAECERLFELFRECTRIQIEADSRTSELRAALREFSSTSWRE
nr:MAG: hypothetical protein [Bacteriophage sp.]